MIITNRHISITALMLMGTLLSGCASSPDDLISQFSTNDESAPPAEYTQDEALNALSGSWYQDQVFTEVDCNSFSPDMVSGMVSMYATPASVNQEGHDSGAEMMQMYTLSSALINRSMLCLSEALELKETTEILIKEREILLSGSSLSRKEVEAHRSLSSEASEAIRQAASEIDKLEPEQKEDLTIGIITFLAGGFTTGTMVESGIDFTEETLELAHTDQINLWDLGDLFDKAVNTVSGTTAMYTIGTGMPEHLGHIFETGSYFIDYAQSQDLDLPEDATSDFMKVGEWL